MKLPLFSSSLLRLQQQSVIIFAFCISSRAKHQLEKQAHGSSLFQQDNLMVTDDETLLYLLIWLLWSFSCELSVHCVYSEMPLASIIIWPCWSALSCPYAAASTVIVSQRRGFGFWCFADVLCLCLLLLLIELQSVYSSPSDADIDRPSHLGVRQLIPESLSAQ